MSDDLSALSQFSGKVRLFPLPGFVLFPSVIHPLHIFEPRYRQMTADALSSDRLIAMAALRPGWEADYYHQPPIHPILCVGKIVSDQRLDDGRYNLLLQGLARARLVEELETDTLYRVAHVELLPSTSSLTALEDRQLRQHLSKEVPGWFPSHAPLVEQFQKLIDSELSLGSLCDILSFALPLDSEFKQRLLAEIDVGRRMEQLLDRLSSDPPLPEAAPAPEALRKFPPDFSSN